MKYQIRIVLGDEGSRSDEQGETTHSRPGHPQSNKKDKTSYPPNLLLDSDLDSFPEFLNQYL